MGGREKIETSYFIHRDYINLVTDVDILSQMILYVVQYYSINHGKHK